jgi:hypothetical protein
MQRHRHRHRHQASKGGTTDDANSPLSVPPPPPSFICLVKSIYLANLTLKMMLAYNEGHIVTVMKRASSRMKQQLIVFPVCTAAKMMMTIISS